MERGKLSSGPQASITFDTERQEIVSEDWQLTREAFVRWKHIFACERLAGKGDQYAERLQRTKAKAWRRYLRRLANVKESRKSLVG